jgi:hypothetical protein
MSGLRDRGRAWRGRLSIPPHCNPLVREFFEILNRQRVLISEVSDQGGPTKAAIRSWRYKNNPSITNMNAALGVIGYELVIRPKRGE